MAKRIKKRPILIYILAASLQVVFLQMIHAVKLPLIILALLI